jgi:hypothetical protein
MTYEKYRIKDRYYKSYFYVIDKSTEVFTMIPTLEIMVDFFKEKYDMDMNLQELKKAKDYQLNLKEAKYKDFISRFTVGMKKQELKNIDK